MVSCMGISSDSVRGIPLRGILRNTVVLLNGEGIIMAKKSKDKRFRIIVQVGIWNSTMTRVYRYERQTVLVTAKSAKKALEKACVKGTVLRVVQG